MMESDEEEDSNILNTEEKNLNANAQSLSSRLNVNWNSRAGEFQDQIGRLGFIRRLYGMFMMQTLVVIGIICSFLYVLEVHTWTVDNYWVWYLALVTGLCLIIALGMYTDPRREYPLNWLCLIVWTTNQGFLLGAVSTVFSTSGILMAEAIIGVNALFIIVFCMQTKHDYTMKMGVMFQFGISCVCYVFIAAIVRSQYFHIFYATFASLMFIIYLVFDTQLMLNGKHVYGLTPEDHTFATLNLYTDMISVMKIITGVTGVGMRDR